MKLAMKTMTLLTTLFCLALGSTYAQNPQTQWSWIHAISDDIDDGRCIRQTDDKGFIITGSFAPNGLITFTDVMLVRTNDSGVVNWTREYDFGFFEEGMAVDQCSDGGYIIAGIRMYGSYPFVEPPVSDALLIRTDANGDTLWTRSFDMGGNEYFTAVKQTSDGGFIMTGAKNSESTRPTWEVNEGTELDSGMTWLVKVDADGNMLWDQAWIYYSNGNDVIQTADGGFLITGCIFQDIGGWQSDVLVIKTDATGWNTWERKFGTEDFEVGFSVAETEEGFIFSGQTKPVGEDYDGLMIKTDLEGNLLWMKSHGSELSDALTAVGPAENGYYFSGTTNGTWWITGYGDMWVVRTDLQGNLLWEELFDLRQSDISYSGTPCCDGGYTILGMTSYGFGGDMWMAKVCDGPAGMPGKDIENSLELLVYPNPAIEAITVRCQIQDSRLKMIGICDIEGKNVYKSEFLEKEIEIDISGFDAGVYFVRIQVGEAVAVRKVVVGGL